MIRVRVAEAHGSTPREAGAAMHVTADALHGTIGGGRLEWLAIAAARAMLAAGETARDMEVPLGPEIGQCCGGRVRLTLERVAAIAPEAAYPTVLILGAGHVGRALARALAPLPLAPLLIDGRAGELALAPPGIPTRESALPEAEIRAAPPGAAYVILTHDHALDFLLAAEALARGDAAYVGLIGSATKRARFERWLGRPAPALTCPIGAAGRGDKRPAVIAAHGAVEVLGAVASPRVTPGPSL